VRSNAFSRTLEKPKERFIFASGHTHNHSRSPRIGSKGWAYWAKVGRSDKLLGLAWSNSRWNLLLFGLEDFGLYFLYIRYALNN
ncbi:hypothetical protein C2G38_1974377, partial [Gigaspora rosea]